MEWRLVEVRLTGYSHPRWNRLLRKVACHRFSDETFNQGDLPARQVRINSGRIHNVKTYVYTWSDHSIQS